MNLTFDIVTSTGNDQPAYQVWNTYAQAFFSYWAKTSVTDLTLTTVTLTFNLVTSKVIGVICWWRPTCTPSMMFLGPSKNNLSAHCHCDLDFRRTDLKTNRDLLLGMANLHTKYRVPRPKHSSIIERKPCFTSQGHHDLELWPSDIKINRGQLLVMTNLHTRYEVPRHKHS